MVIHSWDVTLQEMRVKVLKQIINFLRQFASFFEACFQIKQLENRSHGVSFIVVLYAI